MPYPPPKKRHYLKSHQLSENGVERLEQFVPSTEYNLGDHERTTYRNRDKPSLRRPVGRRAMSFSLTEGVRLAMDEYSHQCREETGKYFHRWSQLVDQFLAEYLRKEGIEVRQGDYEKWGYAVDIKTSATRPVTYKEIRGRIERGEVVLTKVGVETWDLSDKTLPPRQVAFYQFKRPLENMLASPEGRAFSKSGDKARPPKKPAATEGPNYAAEPGEKKDDGSEP
jgi:hypothetical protein